VTVFAPATVANVACGYDVLGFAIDEPGDYIVVRHAEKPGLRITAITGDEGKLPLTVEKNTAGVAALDLLGANAPLAVVIGTAAVINLRMVMYSASIAPYFADYGRRLRAGLAYVLTDQAYALSVAEFDKNSDRSRWRYYVGVAASLWVVWQIGTVVGVVIGTGVPDSWGLTFAVPLVFLALLVPAMKDRPTTAAGVAAGAVAIVAVGLPLNLGLLVGAITGIVVGLVVEVVVE
jgi:predicted branched-subunit amino acid permease